MRIINLIRGDISFQFKYGFYFVYVVLTLLYICFLFVFPSSWRIKAATIMIYSDPAAMGLFFMGAIILLEKSQRVLNSIAVSPVKVEEYILSKVVSLGSISTIVGVLIALSAGVTNIVLVALGTFLGSAIFSLLGLMIAANINSINQFLVATIPIELICFSAPVFYLFGYDKPVMLLHPGCILIRFIAGNHENILPLMILLTLWIVMLFLITCRIINKMFQRVGGVKL